MVSNVDRLYGEVAEWTAEIRFKNPAARVPLFRINYVVSAPAGQPLMHTFVVYGANSVRLAAGGGRTIDEAARACWLDLIGVKRDEMLRRAPRPSESEPRTPETATRGLAHESDSP